MKLHKTLTDLGATKENYYGYPYKLETKTGMLGITLRNNRLCCNFIGGSEKRAELKFGHWKQNAHIENEQDIINHINSLKK